MARSKFFGYTMYGSCPSTKRWSITELPLQTTAVFNSGTATTVAAGSVIPVTGTMINQIGANLQENSVWIPGGFYRISWSTTATMSGSGQLSISLNGSNGVIQSTSGSVTTLSPTTYSVETLGREEYITVNPLGTTLKLTNTGASDITLSGDLVLSITRIL